MDWKKIEVIKRTLLLKTLCVLAMCTLLVAAPHSSYAACDRNISCDELDQCRASETFRIPFDKLRECIAQGIDPPLRWKRLKGMGSINTAGTGSINMGALVAPYEKAKAGLAGGMNIRIPTCSDFVDPRTTGPNETRGGTQPVQNGGAVPCGAAVELGASWHTIIPGANEVLMTRESQNYLYQYRMSGNDLTFMEEFEFPKYYCQYRDSDRDATDRILIKPKRSYIQVSPDTERIVVEILWEDPPPNVEYDLVDGFVHMKKEGNEWVVDAEAEEFRERDDDLVSAARQRDEANGIDTSADDYDNPDFDIERDCYTQDELLRPVPTNLAGILFSSSIEEDRRKKIGDMVHKDVEHFKPLDADEIEACLDYEQGFDVNKAQMIIPAEATLTSGTINGGNPYSTTTVLNQDGNFVLSPQGALIYDGYQLYSGRGTIYMGLGTSQPIRMAFIDGAALELGGGRIVQIHPLGRVELRSNGDMVMIDGAEVEDHNAIITRTIAPMGIVSFGSNRDEAIKGIIRGSFQAPIGATFPVPTAADALVQQPYDVRKDVFCMPDQVGGAINSFLGN